MKIATEVFRAALELASRAAATTTPLDILRTARLVAAGGKLTITCYNLAIYAEAWGECGAGDIECCVRADRLTAALATAGDTIELTHKAGTLAWKSGRAAYKMSTLAVGDFPETKREQDPLDTLDAPEIAASLKRVAAGCATKDIRDWTHGVLVECIAGKGVTLVASDGAKIFRLETGWEAKADANVVLHRDAVNALTDGVERVRIFGNGAEFDYPRGVIVTRSIECRFPDWRRAMQLSEPAAKISVSRRALANAIKAALPFDEMGAIRFVVQKDGMRIEGADKAGELAQLQLDYTGTGEADIWFASGVVSPAVQAAHGENISISLGAQGQPGAFEDGTLRCVCAPLRR